MRFFTYCQLFKKYCLAIRYVRLTEKLKHEFDSRKRILLYRRRELIKEKLL